MIIGVGWREEGTEERRRSLKLRDSLCREDDVGVGAIKGIRYRWEY